MTIDVRPLPPDLDAAAALLLTSAFLDEPYVVEMHGPDPLVRWSKKHARHVAELPMFGLRLLAAAGDAPVGVLLGSLPGDCEACRATQHPGDGPLDRQWYGNLAGQHAHEPEHAWVGKLGVVPALQGRGIARTLLEAAASAVAGAGGTVLLLECQPHREAFYEASGFRRTRLIPDPAGPDAPLMRRDL